MQLVDSYKEVLEIAQLKSNPVHIIPTSGQLLSMHLLCGHPTLKMIYIPRIEMVQCKAARFVLNDFSSYSRVTSMSHKLNWESLEQRRSKAIITMFYIKS